MFSPRRDWYDSFGHNNKEEEGENNLIDMKIFPSKLLRDFFNFWNFFGTSGMLFKIEYYMVYIDIYGSLYHSIRLGI